MNIKKIQSRVKDALRLSAVIGCFAFVINCEQNKPEDPARKEITERMKLENFQCTLEQLDIVKKEYDICVQSNYFSEDCFRIAKKSACTYIGYTMQNGR